MTWLYITIFAYFLNSIAMIIDKTLLKKEIQNPFVYSFYIAAFGFLVLFLALPLAYFFPFQIIWPGWINFLISLSAGGAFSVGLFLLFMALKKEDTSRLVPMVGGLVPLFVLILAFFFLGESFYLMQWIAFLVILVGTFLISLDFRKNHITLRKILWLAFPAAFFFGISYVLTKDVYNSMPFISGFAWTRLGALLVVLIPLLWAKNRFDLMHPPKDANMDKARGRFLFGQASGGVSAVLIQYAISIASVSIVQALQGTQYIFVFIMILISTLYFPKFLKEELSRAIVLQKTVAIILIAIGVYFII